MNTLRIERDKIVEQNLDSSIELVFLKKNEIVSINSIKIIVTKDTSLCIEYTSEGKSKLDIDIEVRENVHLLLKESREGVKAKVKYKYYLKKNSELCIYKVHHIEEIKEVDIIYLEEEGASISYHLETLATEEEKYNIEVYHNAPRTICHLSNKAVNLKNGEVTFHVTNIVEKGKAGCIIHQDSQIITLNNKKSVIKPILLIEENDVDASHSAHIGTFEEDILFYLQSRGIPKKEAIRLLLEGFLLGEKGNKKMKKWIDIYWR